MTGQYHFFEAGMIGLLRPNSHNMGRYLKGQTQADNIDRFLALTNVIK